MYNFVAENVEFCNLDLRKVRIDYVKIEPYEKGVIRKSEADRLCFVANGAGTCEICGKLYEGITRDAVLYAPKNAEIGFKCVDGDSFEIYVIEIDADNPEKFFAGLGFSKDKKLVFLVGKMAIAASLYKVAAGKNLSSAYESAGTLFELLASLAQKCENAEPIEPDDNEYIIKAKEYIHMQYHLNINVNMIANEVYLNRSYFSTIFKKATGMSPLDYLINFRIKQACKLLEMGKSVTDTAMLTGFGSPSGFAAHFKKIMNETPSEYKERTSRGGKI